MEDRPWLFELLSSLTEETQLYTSRRSNAEAPTEYRFTVGDLKDYLLGYFSASTYIFTQASQNATWNIEHNLDKYPSVTIVDASGNVIEAHTEYVDSNNIQLTFSAAYAGKAYLN